MGCHEEPSRPRLVLRPTCFRQRARVLARNPRAVEEAVEEAVARRTALHRRDRVHGRRVVRHWPPRGKVVSRKRRLAGWGGFCLDWAIEACSVFSYSRFQRLALG